MKQDQKNAFNELKESLGLTQEFADKLLRIEKLTMLAKDPKIDARYQCVPDEEVDGYNPTIAFQLKALLSTLSDKEDDIVKNYLKNDYWSPGYWSAGGY